MRGDINCFFGSMSPLAGLRSTVLRLHPTAFPPWATLCRPCRALPKLSPQYGIIITKNSTEQGDLISMEILDASHRVTDAKKMEFQVAWYVIEAREITSRKIGA
jgi:hypothetical protein